MATLCPDVSADPAIMYVGQAHYTFLQRGQDTYDLAIEQLTNLADLQLNPYDFSLSFDFDGQLAAFHRPNKPALDAGEFAFQAPDGVGPAPTFIANPLTFDPAPTFDDAPPSLTFGPKPQTPNITAPIAPPAPGELDMPLEPDYVLPPVPSFDTLNLPPVPSIQIPEFTAAEPVFIEPTFNETWTFESTAYTRVLLDRLVEAIDPMLQSKPALPEAIEAAIFQKGRSRIEVETNRAVDDAFADFANRGFTSPPGMLAGVALELRQGGQDRIAEFNREAVIKQYEETLANLRFAIVQGAALEGVFVQLHVEEQRFALSAAQFQRDSAVAVLNARITIINARVAFYQAQAQVFETRIRAALANVELYRAQIEGELARGQVNEQRVRLYEALLRGVDVLANFYRTRVEAVKVRADADRNIVDRYKAEVDAYDSRWRAFASEYQGYTAGVEAEGKRADLYRTLVDANSKRVDAWSTGQNFKIEAEKLYMASHDQRLRVWDAGVRRFEAEIGGERARLAAVGQKADALTRLYTAEASVEQAASAASDRSLEIGLRAAMAKADQQIKSAELGITHHQGLLSQALEVRKAMAQIASQLAASTQSAVGYSASVNSGRSKGNSCSTNFNLSGEVADAGL